MDDESTGLTMRTTILLLILAVAVALGAFASHDTTPPSTAFAAPSRAEERYAYGSPSFARLVDDSYSEVDSRGIPAFAEWVEHAYAMLASKHPGYEARSLPEVLAERWRQIRSAPPPAQRAQLETQTAAWLHRAVKAMIPRFNLDRGFEFAYVARYGERQCFLQSALIASLLQTMDVDAGVYMVWKNQGGEVSNNGHAVAVIKLSDGRDILVDASEATPFARHQGLFVARPAVGSYSFVEPVYDEESAIVSYRPVGGGPAMRPHAVRPLDVRFLRSQFYFYRGERAPGGFLGKPRTAEGLAASARFLERAERENSRNPLAVYLLGHVYLRQGKASAARTQYEKGYELYEAFGYVPDGPKAAYVRAAR